MRGKDAGLDYNPIIDRITPAYAGKSSFSTGHILPYWDHPRVCGEKRPFRPKPLADLGSPPRMRGKVTSKDDAERNLGITPAYAGKSIKPLKPVTRKRDHPRVCGEKRQTSDICRDFLGSPPRMRGKD